MGFWTKTTRMLLPLTLSISFLAACSNAGTNGPTNQVEPSNTPATNVEATEEAKPFTKYDPPVEISGAIVLRDNAKLLYDDTAEDNPISRWAEETIGIKTKYKWLLADEGDALNQKIRLAMASGEELPDVLFVADTVVLNELMESGMIEPIDEAYEKYATERMRTTYDAKPEVWNIVSKDGQRWGLPQVAKGPSIVGDPVMWVRQDWLDAVGLPAPTTIEEFEAVLAAFKETYPDKLPMAFSGKDYLSAWMADASFLFGKDQILQWNLGDDGKLQYGSVQPYVKKGLQKLNEWYTKGYIDPEFGTIDPNKAAGQFASGDAGIVFGPPWMGGWPLGDTLVNAPDSVVKAYPVPSSVDGIKGHKGSYATYGAFVFRKGFDKWEGVFKYFDATLGRTILDENSEFANGYAEGYDYVMVDGKPVWKDNPGAVNKSSISSYLLLNAGGISAGYDENGKSMYERVAEGSRANVYEQQIAELNGSLFIEGHLAAGKQVDTAYSHQFLAAPTPTMAEKWTLLSKTEVETMLKIVYGRVGLDEFDKFVDEWYAKGGEQITKEVNEWYTSVK